MGAPVIRLHTVRWENTQWCDRQQLREVSGSNPDGASFFPASGQPDVHTSCAGFRRWIASVAGARTGSAISQISDVTGAPFMDGNRVYVGNHSGRTAAFDVASGERLWTAFEGTFGPVWAAGGSLFLVNDRSRLMRLNANDGSAIWSVDLPGYLKDKPRKRAEIVAHHGPILAGGQLVVASNDGLLRFFDPVDGRQTRTAEIKGGATTEPVVANGTLYVVTRDGNLAAFR